MSNLFTKKEVPLGCVSLPPCCLLQEKLTPCYTKLSGATVESQQVAPENCGACFLWITWLITPHVTLWRVRCNSVDIVSVCVCLSVCVCVTTLTAKRTDIHTWISLCRSSGRISRSSSKIKVIVQRSKSLGQKTFFRVANSVWNWIHSIPYMNGRATTWGVFKAYAFFFVHHFPIISQNLHNNNSCITIVLNSDEVYFLITWNII